MSLGVRKIGVKPLTESLTQSDNPQDEKAPRDRPVPSLMELWRYFREETSMHGVKFATRKAKYRFRWIVWSLAVLTMLSVLILTSYRHFHSYFRKQTITNINVRQEKELPFPAVTICNMSPYKRSRLAITAELEQYFLSLSNLGLYYPPPDMSGPFFQTPGNETLLREVSFPSEDMFFVCLYGRKRIHCNETFTAKVTEHSICYTVNSHEYVSKHGLRMTSRTGSTMSLTLYIKVNQSEYIFNKFMSKGIRVTIHDPGEEPDVMNLAFLASPGFTTNAAIKMKKFSYLSSPFMAFSEDYCLDTNAGDFRNPLKYFPTYSKYGCTRECKRNYVVSKCGCRTFTDPGTEEICSLERYYYCYRFYAENFEVNKSAQAECNCRTPCHFNEYTAQISTATFPAVVYYQVLKGLGFTELSTTYIELNVYFDSLTYIEVEQRPEFTPEGFIGVIGGQMGIFLGASLLTLSEIVEFLVIVVVTRIHRIYLKLKLKNGR